jgi:hypothetical protein
VQLDVGKVVELGRDERVSERPVQVDALLVEAACPTQVSGNSRGSRLEMERHAFCGRVAEPSRPLACLGRELGHPGDVALAERDPREHAEPADLSFGVAHTLGPSKQLLAALARPVVVSAPEGG